MFKGGSSGGSISSPPTPYSTDVSNSSTGSIFNPSPTMYTFQRSPDPIAYNKPGRPCLELVEQTAPMFRFRYVTEMQGTHGAIRGINSGKNEKTFPTVKLCNYNAPAVIRCTLYTVDKKSLHVHRLVGKCSGEKKDDPHDIQVGPNRHNGFIASFQNLVIIHTAKKQLVNELIEKKKRVIKANYPNSVGFDIAPETLKKMQKEAQEETKKMDPNCACLRFEALILQNGHYVPLPDCKPIYSNGIKNMKNHVTGQLKICRIDRVSGSCEGGDEIFLFVEKVGKDNVKVIMTECDEFGEEVWHDYCTFSPSDVHHQFGIVCKTPKYRSSDIKQKVTVKLQLERKTDCARSEPVEFTYKPRDHHVQFTESCKRKRLASEISSVDLPHVSPPQNLEVTSTTGLETSDHVLRHKIPFGNLSVFDYDDNMEQDPMWSKDYVALADDSELFAPFEKSTSFTEIVEQLPTPDYDQIKTVCNSDPADMGFTYVDNVPTKIHIVDPPIAFNQSQPRFYPQADFRVFHQIDSVNELRPKPRHSSHFVAQPQMGSDDSQMDSVKELRPKPRHSSHVAVQREMATGVSQMDSVKEIGPKPGQSFDLNRSRPIQHEMYIRQTTANNEHDIHYADHEVEPRTQGCETAYFQSGIPEILPEGPAIYPSDALVIDGVEVRTKVQWTPYSELRKNHDLIEHLGKSATQKEALKWKILSEAYKDNVPQSGVLRILAESFVSRVNQSLRRYRDAECFPCINVDKDILPKVKKLLSVRTVHGNGCVHTAVIHKQIDELRTLIRYLQLYKSTEYINDTNSSQQTALHLAVYDESKINIEMIKMLIEAGGDANKPDKYGRSTLHIAVRLNHRSIVKCLLETQQIDIDYVSESDGTALHIATENNRVDIVKLLLEYGADVNSINHKDGRTPLHIAVSHKNEDIASLLVQQRNLAPEKKDFKGYTPFKLALVNDSEWWRKITKLLGKCSNEEVGEVGEEVCVGFIKLMIKENDKENGEADS